MENQNRNRYPEVRSTANQEYTIDLVEVFYLLWGHALQIVACVLVGAVLGFGYTYYNFVPQYQATAQIYIVSASNESLDDLTDLELGISLITEYQDLMLSRPLLEKVAENLNLNLSYKSLKSMISITNESKTRILKIEVTDSDPQRAADIANELVTQASIYLPEIMEMEAPNLVESAVASTSSSKPEYSNNIAIGAVLGAILSCGILLIRYLMNDTLVTPDDVVKYFGVQPLAVILEGDLGDTEQRDKDRKKPEDQKGW